MIRPDTHGRMGGDEVGAALVTTLILLTVVTLLAIAAMRSTSFGFIMAGNDQLRERAFVAAESGIEQAIATANFDPNNVTPVTLPTCLLYTSPSPRD